LRISQKSSTASALVRTNSPSDYPEFAQFLVEQGIDSISLNPDTVLKTTLAILETEAALKNRNGA
jgi:phosphoenolpyruvate synthase/pyruvate phosphate dikinase